MRQETETLIAAAKDAGAILMKHFRNGENHARYKNGNELVSDVDFESNEAIITRLREAFPDHRILSEESDEKELTKDPTFVIDPLDGTKNYVYGIALFGTILALCEGGEPTIGVMYDPITDELFVAEKGEGLTLNGERITVSDRTPEQPGIFFAGRGSVEKDERHATILYELEQETPYFRRFGTAITMLSSVAAGRADAVVLTGTNKPWDVVAGVLMIKEAGGMVTDYCGREWKDASQDIVGTNGKMHDFIVDVTKQIEETKC